MAEMAKPVWQDLIEKYLNNSISREEFEKMLQKAATHEDMEALSSVLKAHWEKQPGTRLSIDWNKNFEAMMEETRQVTPVVPMQKSYKRQWLKFAAAAAILVAILTTTFFLINNRTENNLAQQKNEPSKENDLTPGRNTAILTLVDGTTIVLDSLKNGFIATQGNTKVVKLDDGQLAYNTTGINANEVLYNTMTTPRGGQYKLLLPDGSRVWLNAASSIRYPTSFQGNERKVEITGEAYFEVAHDAAKPFKVSANEMDVQVLGTHFNVNAYNDEPSINTTLLEGSVKISKGQSTGILKPGQQGRLSSTGSIKIINDVDLDAVMAWKNGYFSFANADLVSIMRQISRWYDVDIVYEGKVPDRKFGGDISRSMNASQVLKILEESGVHFKIDGKKIIVLP